MIRKERLLQAGIALAVVLSMGASLGNGFVYDDVSIIVNNPLVTDPARWHDIFRSTYWMGTLWRPVPVAAYAVQWYLGNGGAWLFHLVSLILYLVLAWGILRLLREIGASPVASGVAVLVFVVHPAHVEVVANVVGQAELWMAISLLGTTWCYLRLRRVGPTLPLLLALLATIAIATMSKEQGFVAPVVLVGAEWLLVSRQDEGWRDRIRVLLPATSFSLLMLLVRSTVTGTFKGEIASAALDGLGFRDRLVTFVGVVPDYARLLVWPVHLQAEYSPPHTLIAGPLTAKHLVGIALILLVVGTLFFLRRRMPLVAFGLWWAVIAIGPVSSVLTPVGIVMAERVLLLPTVGLALALAGAGPWLRERVPRQRQVWLAAPVALWVAGATVRSATRVGVWHDQDGFFTRITMDGPRDYRAWGVAGTYWMETGRTALAERDLRQALRLWPHDVITNAHLGQLLRGQGRCQEAVPILEQGLLVEPDHTAVRAKLIECLTALGQRARATTIADEGIALGDSSFQLLKRRILANPQVP